jgi:hypothetical protein
MNRGCTCVGYVEQFRFVGWTMQQWT